MRSEDERMADAIAEHPGYEDGLVHGNGLPNVDPVLHIAMHAVVEAQLEMNDPRKTREVLNELLRRGMDRHDAIHAIATAATYELNEIAKHEKPSDPKRYKRFLNRVLKEYP